MTNLRTQLQQLATILPPEHREMVSGAMFLAVEMAFSRIHELGSSYDLGKGVEAVELELRDDGSRSAKVRPAALSRNELPPPESPEIPEDPSF